MAALLCLSVGTASAQTFKLQCDLEGKPSEPVLRISPARVDLELQVIGRNLYFHMSGPPYYEMRVSTLVTDEFLGENLTSGTQVGARRQQRSTQRELEIVIERGSMEFTGHQDLVHAGKPLRMRYAGKCRPA